MKPLLSIVIPVYNVETYVEKCVRSVYDQNLSDNILEVIIVNDGSRDNSLKICEDLKKEYPKTQIINQENKGLSGARNTGLSHSKGKYVWFVDSDDWLPSNSIKPIISILDTQSPDFIWLGHSVVQNQRIIKTYLPKVSKTPIKGDDFFKNHLNGLFYIWKFIYNRNFLNNHGLRFYEGLLYEDLEFTPRFLEKAKSAISLQSSFYYYLIREGSIANKIGEKNIADRFFIIENHFKRLTESNNSNEYKDALLFTCLDSYVGTVKLAARNGIPLSRSNKSLWKALKSLEEKSQIKFPFNKLMKINLTLYHSLYGTVRRTYKSLFK